MGYAHSLAQRWIFKRFFGFGDRPTHNDLVVYFKLLLCCANADGQLAEAEREWVLGYAAAAGLEEPELEALADYPADDDLIELLLHADMLHTAARSLVWDALLAASADGELHPEERSAILRLADQLALDANDVSRIVAVYEVEQSDRARRIQALYPDGAPY